MYFRGNLAMTETRGVRNNNPGNVRKGTAWNGLDPEGSDPDFCVFLTPQYGIRVIAKLMFAYQDFHDLNTIRGIVDRWAPPSENDTDAYAQFVAEHAGWGIDTHLNLHTMPQVLRGMVVAIIAYENAGYAYDNGVVTAGLQLAIN